MTEELGFHVIDAALSIEEQQQQMRSVVVEALGEHLATGILRAPQGAAYAVK
jgi:hypothetical protein